MNCQGKVQSASTRLTILRYPIYFLLVQAGSFAGGAFDPKLLRIYDSVLFEVWALASQVA